MLIRLTAEDGTKLLINSDHVVSIKPSEHGGSFLTLTVPARYDVPTSTSGAFWRATVHYMKLSVLEDVDRIASLVKEG